MVPTRRRIAARTGLAAGRRAGGFNHPTHGPER